MKASELRIGNWVNWYNEWHQDLYFDAQITIDSFNNTDFSRARPIPLTEEWLQKFGFDANQDLYVRGLIMRYNFSYQIIELVRFETIIDFKVEYVHTLQNLYFALTGEELILKG